MFFSLSKYFIDWQPDVSFEFLCTTQTTCHTITHKHECVCLYINSWEMSSQSVLSKGWSKSTVKLYTATFKQLVIFWDTSVSLFWQTVIINSHECGVCGPFHLPKTREALGLGYTRMPARVCSKDQQIYPVDWILSSTILISLYPNSVLNTRLN